MTKKIKVDPAKCTGCMQCELACSWVQVGRFQPSASVIRVHIFDEQAQYTPYTCFQCDEAWCMTVCPTHAIAVNPETGAKVVIDEVCVGCGLCVLVCPFGTIFLDPASHKARKCDLCGGEPACVAACPTDCLTFEEGVDDKAWTEQFGNRLSEAYRRAFVAS